MSKALYLTIAVLVSFQAIYSQSGPGARQTAMGNSGVALADDAFSVFNNPAGLAQMDWRELAVFYSPSPFGLKELSSACAAWHEPVGYGSLAAGFTTFGFQMYRENTVLLGVSHKFRSVLLGLTVNYHTVSIINYGTASAFYFNLGALVTLTNEVSWGLCVSNVTRSTVGGEAGQLPYGFSSGLAFSPSEDMVISASAVKQEGFAYDLRGGIEYLPVPFIALRSGFSSETNRFSAGLGIIYKWIQLDYAVFTHDDLGLTHQIGLVIGITSEGTRTSRIKASRISLAD